MTAPRETDRTAALHSPLAGAQAREVRLRIASRTDPGLVRTNNEDSFVVADLSPPSGQAGAATAEVGLSGPKGILLAVSDGMGGHQAGEVASSLAVRTLREVLAEEWSARPERDAVAELRNDLRTAVDRANREVVGHAEENPERAGMGATLTAAVVLGNTLVLAHVGDSRCYLLRGGVLKSLTSDQSLAEELVRRGILARDSAAYAARRSILTRVVGQKGRLEPDSEAADLARGDRLLLCSDGLYGPVDEDAIREILADAESPEEAAEDLVAEARRRGAPDNVTCIVAFLSGSGLPEAEALDGGGGTMSIALDAALARAGGDSTLAFAQAKAEATGEFTAKDVKGDDTLIGAVAADAAEVLAAEAEEAGSSGAASPPAPASAGPAPSRPAVAAAPPPAPPASSAPAPPPPPGAAVPAPATAASSAPSASPPPGERRGEPAPAAAAGRWGRSLGPMDVLRIVVGAIVLMALWNLLGRFLS